MRSKAEAIKAARVEAAIGTLRAQVEEARARQIEAKARQKSIRAWEKSVAKASAAVGGSTRGSVAAPYAAAERSNLRPDVPPLGGAGDLLAKHQRRDTMRREARQAFRNTTVAPMVLTAMVDFILGPGLWPQVSLPGGDQANANLARQIEDAFIQDAETLEYTGRFGWGELQRQILMSAMIDGDALGVMIDVGGDSPALAVQIVEGQLVRDKSGIYKARDLPADGVRLDATGRVLGYNVAEFVSGRVSQSNIRTIDREDCVFFAFTQSPSQYRGVPVISNVIDRIIAVDRMIASYVAAADLAARLSAFTTSRRPDSTSKLIGRTSKESPNEPRTTAIPEGSIHHLGDDATVMFPQSSYPAAAFDSSIRMIMRLLGAAVGLPIEVLMLDTSQSTAYAGRTGVMLGQRRALPLVNRLIREVCRPIFNRWVRTSAENGRIRLSPEQVEYVCSTAGNEWPVPPIGLFDPAKETQAIVDQINANLISKREAVERLTGRDAAQVRAEREVEVRDEESKRIRPVLMPGQSAGGAAGGEAPPA
jgi:capsid protein